MTAREIAEKTWELWNDYYKDGDLGSKEIIDIIETDIKALTIPDVAEQSEQLKAFADYIQKRMWEVGDKDLSELVEEFLIL